MGATATAIGHGTWRRLVEANRSAAWAERGVFATGIGPEYLPGGRSSLLYVGKSAGPLGAAVGSGEDQIRSASASTHGWFRAQTYLLSGNLQTRSIGPVATSLGRTSARWIASEDSSLQMRGNGAVLRM